MLKVASYYKLFQKLRREEPAAKERTKAKKLLKVARQLLAYHENGFAVYLPFSIGTVRPYHKNGTAVVRLDIRQKQTNYGNGYSILQRFNGVKTATLFWRLL